MKNTEMKNTEKVECVWITVPHQGTPDIFGTFNNRLEALEFIQEHESSEHFSTSNLNEVNEDDFLDDARRQYHAAYILTHDELKKSVIECTGKGHMAVELQRLYKEYIVNNFYNEAREDFLNGFAATCGESKESSEEAWDSWSNNIQAGAIGEALLIELKGEAAGREEGSLYAASNKSSVA